MKIAITGGHLSPALAVIEKLKEEEIIFIGRRFGLEGDRAESFEYKTITSIGIPFYNLNTGRLQRKITKYTFSSLLKIPSGFLESLSILKKNNPDVVLGFGGYLSFPVIFAAFFLKIPIVIHEQTLEAGVANKYAAFFARTVCISWPSSFKYFPKKKTVLTGNPIRNEILNIKNQKSSFDYAKDKSFGEDKTRNRKPFIYITGGSAGSHQINSLVEEVLPELLNNFEIIHQTGDSEEFADYERLLKLKERLPKELQERYSIFKFLDSKKASGDMVNADLIIGRSGINTVTEILFLEKPALLIPLSFGQKNEQLKNAMFLKESGLAEVLTGKIKPEDFLNAVKKMFQNKFDYKIKKNFEINEDSANLIVKELKRAAK